MLTSPINISCSTQHFLILFQADLYTRTVQAWPEATTIRNSTIQSTNRTVPRKQTCTRPTPPPLKGRYVHVTSETDGYAAVWHLADSLWHCNTPEGELSAASARLMSHRLAWLWWRWMRNDGCLAVTQVDAEPWMTHGCVCLMKWTDG